MPTAFVIRKARPEDIAEISHLHARVFGPGRFARSAYRVREGKGHLSRFCLVAEDGAELVASLRMTEIAIGGTKGAALLGPVVVDPAHRGLGLGTRLVTAALEAARTAGTELVVLVGDDPYYGRFGFKRVPAGQIIFPGPVNPARILACELKAGALAAHRGQIVAEPPAPITVQHPAPC
jgi:predicted N-acetyltransferase YhbS